MLALGPSTLTPNEARAPTWFSKKATFVQDLVRSQPVTRMISSYMFDTQLKPSGERESVVDMLHYPPHKSTQRKSVFTSSCYWQG